MPASDSTRSHWHCPRGAGSKGAEALLDHQAWCTRDRRTNVQLIERVARTDGEVMHEGLVAAAHQHRLAAEATRHDN